MTNDLISRAALFNALANVKTIEEAFAVIQGMPAVERWIPCAERLPESIENGYWICTDGGYQCQCRWTNDVFGLGAGDKWAWKLLDIPQYSRVVAWMPLPEPYKGEV